HLREVALLLALELGGVAVSPMDGVADRQAIAEGQELVVGLEAVDRVGARQLRAAGDDGGGVADGLAVDDLAVHQADHRGGVGAQGGVGQHGGVGGRHWISLSVRPIGRLTGAALRGFVTGGTPARAGTAAPSNVYWSASQQGEIMGGMGGTKIRVLVV